MFVFLKSARQRTGNILPQSTPQIFDLLQLSRKEREHRTLCKSMLGKFNAWKKNYRDQTDHSLKLCAQVEGILLRRQAQDAVLFYRMVRKERVRKFRDYLEKLPAQKSLFRAAS